MKFFKVFIVFTLLGFSIVYANDRSIVTKMGKVEIQTVNEYEHWLTFNDKRMQKFEERYVSFKEHYGGSRKSIIILSLDTGTSMVKPEYAVIEIKDGRLHLSNRVISYDYTFKVTKATNKKIIMDIGLSDSGNKRIATYKDGKITVREQTNYNAIASIDEIEAQKRAIHAHLPSFFMSESRLEGDMGIEAADGTIEVYKKDNFDVKYAKLTLLSDGTTNNMELYFKDNKLFYAQENIQYSAEFARSAGLNPADAKDMNKYYFFNAKLAKVEKNAQEIPKQNLGHFEHYITKIANAIIDRNVCDN